MITSKINYKKIILFSSLYLSLPVFIIFTDPEKLPLPMLIVPFLLLFLVLYASAYYLLGRFKNINLAQRRVATLIISIIPVMLAILQSLKQLTLRDTLLSLTFMAIVSWYIIKFRGK